MCQSDLLYANYYIDLFQVKFTVTARISITNLLLYLLYSAFHGLLSQYLTLGKNKRAVVFKVKVTRQDHNLDGMF